MEDGIKNYRTEPNPATTLYAVTSVSLSPTQNDSDICCFHIIMMEKLAYICRIISITLTRDALIYKGSGILCVLNLIVLLCHIRTRVPEVIDTIKNWNREQKKKWWLIVTVWWGTQKRDNVSSFALHNCAFFLSPLNPAAASEWQNDESSWQWEITHPHNMVDSWGCFDFG